MLDGTESKKLLKLHVRLRPRDPRQNRWKRKCTERQEAQNAKVGMQILGHLLEGAGNKQIALGLGIAEATVKVHVKAILKKIRVQNRTQAAIWALTQDLRRTQARSHRCRQHAELRGERLAIQGYRLTLFG